MKNNKILIKIKKGNNIVFNLKVRYKVKTWDKLGNKATKHNNSKLIRICMIFNDFFFHLYFNRPLVINFLKIEIKLTEIIYYKNISH
jgi:hypothetical protein